MSTKLKLEFLNPNKITHTLQTLINNFAFADTSITCIDGKVIINRALVGIIFPFLNDSFPFNSIGNITMLIPEQTMEEFWSNLSCCLGIKEYNLDNKELLENDLNNETDENNSTSVGEIDDYQEKTSEDNFILEEYDDDVYEDTEDIDDIRHATGHKIKINILNEIEMKNKKIANIEEEMEQDDNNLNLTSSVLEKQTEKDEKQNFTNGYLEFSKDCLLKKILKEKILFQNSSLALCFIFSWCDNNLSPLIIESQTSAPVKIILKCPHAPQKGSSNNVYEDKGCPVGLTLVGVEDGHFLLERAELEHQNHEISYKEYRTLVKNRKVKEVEEDRERIIEGLLKSGFSTTEVVEYFSGYNTMDVTVHQIVEILQNLKNRREINIKEEEIRLLVKSDSKTSGLSCSICLRSFHTKKYMLAHMFKKHEISTPVICPKCDHTSENIEIFRKHNKEAHTVIKHHELQQCELCKKRIGNMKEHMKCHSAVEAGAFQCNECGHKSANYNNLRMHLRVHSDAKMFKCKECEKSFKWQSSLSHHEVAAHSKVAPLFLCEECSHPFKGKSNLAKHMFTHKTEKPHTCEKCGKGWIRLDFLKNHKCLVE